MSVFPLFVDLKGKNCVVVGGGTVAYRKIEVLSRFEAELCVVAPDICDAILLLASNGRLRILKKEYAGQDIEEAFLVVAATSFPEVNRKIYLDAVKRKIPVNTVDDPLKCTFFFPAVVNRGDLTIGISSSGSCPAFSKKIREITEEIFHEEYAGILKRLSEFRTKLRKSHMDYNQKDMILKQAIQELYEKGRISCDAMGHILEELESKYRKEMSSKP